MLYRYFPSSHIVRGRPRHPQSQGAVERGNGPFKDALQKWRQEHPNDSWALIGIFVVQDGLNKKPCRNKGNHSAYEPFFGKLKKNSARCILDQSLIDMCQTEDGLQAAIDLVKQSDEPPSTEDIQSAIREADMLFEEEERKGCTGVGGAIGIPEMVSVPLVPPNMATTVAEGLGFNKSDDFTSAAAVELASQIATQNNQGQATDTTATKTTTEPLPETDNAKEHAKEAETTKEPAKSSSNSSCSSSDMSSTTFEDKCRETMKVGDEIEYYHIMYTAGDPRALCRATVIRVDPYDSEEPLTLSNSDPAPERMKVKRVKGEMPEGKTAKFRSISRYHLEEGGSGGAADGIMAMAGRLSDSHNQRRVALLEGNDSMPVDLVRELNGGTRITTRSRGASQTATTSSKKKQAPPTSTTSSRPAKKRAATTDTDNFSPTRASIRKTVEASKRKQAEQVNKSRLKTAKFTLDVGDMCNVVVEGNTRAATDFLKVPVLVVSVRVSATTSHTSYQIASRDGYLKGWYQRERLVHHPGLTATLMGIDVNVPDFKKNLDVNTASALFNVGGGCKPCECQLTNCATNGRCTCMEKKQFCTTKCHKGRGVNKKCTLMPPPPPGRKDICSPCNGTGGDGNEE